MSLFSRNCDAVAESHSSVTSDPVDPVSPVSPVSPYIPVSQVSQVSPYIPEIDINCEPIITRIPSVPSVPRASSLQIAYAWDFYQGEERQKFIRQARLRHFY